MKCIKTFTLILIILCSIKLNNLVYASVVQKEDTLNNSHIDSQVMNEAEILSFHVDEKKQDSIQGIPAIYENDKISFLIKNPGELLRARPNDMSKLLLYVDGFPIKSINSDFYNYSSVLRVDLTHPLPKTIRVHFVFIRDTSKNNTWLNFYHNSEWLENNVRLKLSLGWEGVAEIGGKKPEVMLILFQKHNLLLFTFGYIAFISLMFFLCIRSSILKDDSLPCAPYSFASTQLAFWSIIVIGGFVYLSFLTGQINSLNSSILILLGINSSSSVISNLINNVKKKPSQHSSQIIKTSKSFFQDLLFNDNGLDIKYVVTFLWNLILAGYYIWYVLTNKNMPTFSNGLLLLAGVGSLLSIKAKDFYNPATMDHEEEKRQE